MNPPKAFLGTKEFPQFTVARICCKCESKEAAQAYAESMGIPRNQHSHTFCEDCANEINIQTLKERAA